VPSAYPACPATIFLSRHNYYYYYYYYHPEGLGYLNLTPIFRGVNLTPLFGGSNLQNYKFSITC
jgi:hypothetical protein